jgi:hypothetical protein
MVLGVGRHGTEGGADKNPLPIERGPVAAMLVKGRNWVGGRLIVTPREKTNSQSTTARFETTKDGGTPRLAL